MNFEKYLPIGTVVMLKNGKKRVMITGFIATAPETEGKMFDYIGCLYPEGVISSDKNLLFNHEQIGQIFYMGLIDEEWRKVELKIKEIVTIKSKTPENKVEQLPETEEDGQVGGTAQSENIFRVNTNLFD